MCVTVAPQLYDTIDTMNKLSAVPFCNGSGLRMYRPLSLDGFNTEKTSKRDDRRQVLASLFLTRFIYEPSVTI